MQDFTAGSLSATPIRRSTTGDPKIDGLVKQLVAASGCQKSCEYVEDLVNTVLKMGRDRTTVADLKLFNRSLREMRHAAHVFASYKNVPKVVVFGSARTAPTEPEAIAAEEFARRMQQEHGYMTITGGGEGIMGAAQRGAGREHGFGLNIRLPFEQSANATIDGDPKLINFNYFFTRKLNFLKETHAVALFPGGFGTMDEGFEVLTLMQTGKARILPVIMLDRPDGGYWKTWFAFLGEYLLKLGLVSKDDFHLFKITSTVDEAINEITQFYRNFKSYRWVAQQLAIRIETALTPDALVKLNSDFADLLVGDTIIQTTALPQEHDEPEIAALPRLVLTPKRRNFGRLRQLIDAINLAGTAV